MLAIGAGAREESLRFIEQLGVRNVLVDSRPATSQEELQQRRRVSPGLTERDVRILKANIEALETLSPRRSLHPARVLPKPSQRHAGAVWRAAVLRVDSQPAAGGGPVLRRERRCRERAVCVLGESAKVNLLGYGPALGKFVKVNDYVARSGGRAGGTVGVGVAIERRPHAGSEQHHLHAAEHLAIPLLGPERLSEGRSGRRRYCG